MTVVIAAEELSGLSAADGRPPVLLDVRWQLGDAHGHDHYLEGHLPGAVYVDL